ncbi:DUF2357 domain-containing protein [Ectobacillus sp. sgz5001026]|uniref:DUF2357 domain-containing protein n=1 Tax=Ectobacillus sp. sgz5001026 TaxID=3242473 RepID=UPI0036D43DFD
MSNKSLGFLLSFIVKNNKYTCSELYTSEQEAMLPENVFTYAEITEYDITLHLEVLEGNDPIMITMDGLKTPRNRPLRFDPVTNRMNYVNWELKGINTSRLIAYCGDYMLTVKRGNEVWYLMFRIYPDNIRINTLSDMMRELENFVKSITIDVTSPARMRSRINEDTSTKNYYHWYEMLKEIIETISSTVISISKNPLQKIETAYKNVDGRKSKAVDSRGQMLQLHVKNQNPNRGIAKEYYSSYNTSDNQFLKDGLNLLIEYCEELTQSILNSIQQEKDRISTFESRNTHLDEITRKKYIAPSTRKINRLNSILADLSGIRVTIEQLCNEWFFQKVDTRYLDRRKSIKSRDVRYNVVFEELNRLEDASFEVHFDSISWTRLKRTFILYEYWCYFLVISKICRLGFTPTNQFAFTFRQIGKQFEVNLPYNFECELIDGDGNRIIVAYEEQIPYALRVEDARSQGYDYFGTSRMTPDIHVRIYTSNQLYKGSIVFDAKYKPRSMVWDETNETSDQDQINKYTNQIYHTLNQRSEVACGVLLFPDMDEEINFIDTDVDNILNPNMNRTGLLSAIPGQENEEIEKIIRVMIDKVLHEKV